MNATTVSPSAVPGSRRVRNWSGLLPNALGALSVQHWLFQDGTYTLELHYAGHASAMCFKPQELFHQIGTYELYLAQSLDTDGMGLIVAVSDGVSVLLRRVPAPPTTLMRNDQAAQQPRPPGQGAAQVRTQGTED